MPNTYSTTEAAKLLNISERTLRQWILDDHLKAEKLNPASKSVYRIPASEIDRIISLRHGKPHAKTTGRS